jgi:hypothetical protein
LGFFVTNVFYAIFYFASDENENGGTGSQTAAASSVCAADVVLYGLNIIAPLMTTELLKVMARLFMSCSFKFLWSERVCVISFLCFL